MKIALFDPNKTLSDFTVASIDGKFPILWTLFTKIDDEANKILLTKEFDAIITTKELEEGSVNDVLDSCSASTLNQETPVFLLSSDVDTEGLNKAFDIGITDVFARQELAALGNTLDRIQKITHQVSGAYVLLVEDDKAVSDYHSAALRKFNFVVRQAYSCDEAFEILNQHPIELVITDLNLDNGGHGQRVIRKIRHNEHINSTHIPIMVMSSSSKSQHKTGLFYLGIDEYVVKPTSAKQMGLRAVSLIKKYRAHVEAKNNAEKLKEVAHFDSLTRLYNRHGFQDIASFCVANCQRQVSSTLGIMYLDLDSFKPINDNYGHKTGDDILRNFADILKQELREQDVIARWGGDEFIVLLNQCDITFITAIIKRIKLRISKEKVNLLGVECSIGVAYGEPKSFKGLCMLIEEADKNMYIDKQVNRGELSYFNKNV